MVATIIFCLVQAILLSQTLHADEHFCRVHHCLTQFGLCTVIYGERAWDEKFRALESEFFPMANEVKGGGCGVPVFEVGWRYTLYCPYCRRAYELWKTERKFAHKN
jgi:hypothetical protein